MGLWIHSGACVHICARFEKLVQGDGPGGGGDYCHVAKDLALRKRAHIPRVAGPAAAGHGCRGRGRGRGGDSGDCDRGLQHQR